MEDTTIKIKQDTKAGLDSIKREGETYDQAIARLMQKALRDERLKEGYLKNAERDLALCKEWEAIDAPWPE